MLSSTAATYGEPETMPIVEETPQAPVNPYGTTKLACEQLLITRVTNLYRDGYALRTSNQLEGARQKLYSLLRLYPDNHSAIHRNVSLQVNDVNRRSRRR